MVSFSVNKNMSENGPSFIFVDRAFPAITGVSAQTKTAPEEASIGQQ
jgi:hypothetical protein